MEGTKRKNRRPPIKNQQLDSQHLKDNSPTQIKPSRMVPSSKSVIRFFTEKARNFAAQMSRNPFRLPHQDLLDRLARFDHLYDQGPFDHFLILYKLEKYKDKLNQARDQIRHLDLSFLDRQQCKKISDDQKEMIRDCIRSEEFSTTKLVLKSQTPVKLLARIMKKVYLSSTNDLV